MDPHQYPRRVLVCATGLSPQVVTETIYALARQQTPAFVPTEVHIITTAEGAHRARLMLLEGKAGKFQQLCEAYDLQGIEFGKANIHVICGRDGEPLDDIVDADANTACADAMVRMIADISRDDDSAMHVSIAGGRKTMGYLLGYALTLFGREQDRLSHVLVSSPYESNPGFYFPTRESHILQTRDGRPIDASEAQVQLVSIPYVSLRSGLAGQLANHELTFSDSADRTVTAAIIGGTASSLSGGKFSDGAASAAFSQIYSDASSGAALNQRMQDASQMGDLDYAVAFEPPVPPQWLVDGVTGSGDGVYSGITFGLGDLQDVRNLVGITGDIDSSSEAYQYAHFAGVFEGGAALGGSLAAKSFVPGGWTNSNRYLRIGYGRNGGDRVFRAAGQLIKSMTGDAHVDFWTAGKW